MLKEFREFIERGSVIDLAVAVIMGVAFGKIVTSLVDGIIMPPIGLILGGVDFASLFVDLSGQNPASLADAKTRGLPVIAYGTFINDVISFLIIAFVVFLIVRAINKRRRKDEPATRDCPHCLTAIPVAASRCAACCAEIQTVRG
ncbi:MAG TPA: large conductance mechanosensitive channel protein MscL [Pyrinomonadaceae bacterium]|nr:large conductance mechanosensitive channel protein MscL [Pyrinomonadaceae bacterium]